MTLEQVYFITQIGVGIGFIISIVFLAVQVRQNTYLLRKSMADQREERINWFFETSCTNNEFRHFQSRINTEWEQFDDDERFRGTMLGIRTLRSLLNELTAYFDGQVSENEFRNLRWNMVGAKGRPNVRAAYEYLKQGYSDKVQNFWDDLETSNAFVTVPSAAQKS